MACFAPWMHGQVGGVPHHLHELDDGANTEQKASPLTIYIL
jgi:hypothetical protein